jgi:hypothetical protein
VAERLPAGHGLRDVHGDAVAHLHRDDLLAGLGVSRAQTKLADVGSMLRFFKDIFAQKIWPKNCRFFAQTPANFGVVNFYNLVNLVNLVNFYNILQALAL